MRPSSAGDSAMNDKIAASRALLAGQIAKQTGGGDLHPELSKWPELCISSRTWKVVSSLFLFCLSGLGLCGAWP